MTSAEWQRDWDARFAKLKARMDARTVLQRDVPISNARAWREYGAAMKADRAEVESLAREAKDQARRAEARRIAPPPAPAKDFAHPLASSSPPQATRIKRRYYRDPRTGLIECVVEHLQYDDATGPESNPTAA